MIYQIRQAFWTLGENEFFIFDDDGNKVFRVVGTAFEWGTNLSFRDIQGKELATISQERSAMTPVYSIHRNGTLFAEVRKESSWSGKSFTLDVPGPNDYTIEGQFWLHEFNFIRQGRVVANVSKALFQSLDIYGVKIIPGEDDVAILCTALIIDEVLFDEDDRKM